jgi:hypothetical protein
MNCASRQVNTRCKRATMTSIRVHRIFVIVATAVALGMGSTSSCSLGRTITPGMRCSLKVYFNPLKSGRQTATVLLASNTTDPVLTVQVMGRATIPAHGKDALHTNTDKRNGKGLASRVQRFKSARRLPVV